MKVHFACSTSELDIYGKNYLDICNIIRDLGHIIARDWIENAVATLNDYKKGKFKIDRVDIYNKAVQSILVSDFIVIEGTVSSFSIGHQLTLALSKNKPVLYMIYRDGGENKNKLQNNFVYGINSPLLTIAKYSSVEDIKNILINFFNNNSNITTKFNIVLNKEIDNYLDWSSFYYKKNKSEFIRDIINKHMKETDLNYKKYLSSPNKDI
ncbi:MAG: hypothetical protein WCX74_01860 [Candidatus Paceibacterota bacterium]